MITLAAVIATFEKRFLARYQHAVLPDHRKALAAMKRCRQESNFHMLAQCTDKECGRQVYIPHSCGHRNCPHCQHHESQQWILTQVDKQLPAPYFLLTFTLPAQLRDSVLKNQRTAYPLMFAAMQETLKSFVRNDKQLGGDAGFTAILHTHARNLDFHPHIHVVMPAACIAREQRLWRVKQGKWLFKHTALAKVFRAKLLQAMVDSGLPVPATTAKQWVVHCKNVGNGAKAIVYLGRYLYRGVIREKDILHYDHNKVTFRYLHAKSKKYRTRTVDGEHFLYLLMLHVLPTGFRRTRSYGFLHHCSKRLIALLRLILRVKTFQTAIKRDERPKIVCPCCGAPMKIVRVMVRRTTSTPARAGCLLQGGPVM
jgi:ssDNA-binding Zn-finger/Zn-ribbon topoisomerase 1